MKVVLGSDDRTPLTDAVAWFSTAPDPDEAVNIGRLEPG